MGRVVTVTAVMKFVEVTRSIISTSVSITVETAGFVIFVVLVVMVLMMRHVGRVSLAVVVRRGRRRTTTKGSEKCMVGMV